MTSTVVVFAVVVFADNDIGSAVPLTVRDAAALEEPRASVAVSWSAVALLVKVMGVRVPIR
ncbi:hypothetical protein [Streptomyces sp. 900105755]